MCVAALAWDAHPDWLLVVAGNRDEHHARPAAPLSHWNDGSGIIAGTDLTGGGTWLGVSAGPHGAGRFALVTNYRVPEGSQPGRPSRGRLVTDLLIGASPDQVERMNAFNLIHSNGETAWFLTNHPHVEHRRLERGIHGLSNGGFDVPWPKTMQVQRALASWMDQADGDPEPLLAALRDATPAPSPEHPEHGPEPRFAPVFIRNAVYGTRCSTVIAVRRDGQGVIVERSFDVEGEPTGDVRIAFTWPV